MSQPYECLHCGDSPTHARGLCRICYLKADIRKRYPKHTKDCRELTMEELDAMIAEQMANLPTWWHKERPND